MKVLNQWICDSCGYLIEGPISGILEMKCAETTYDLRIVHNPDVFSPDSGVDCKSDESCGAALIPLPLSEALGVVGRSNLLSLLDNTSDIKPEFRAGPLKDIKEWIQIFHRLHTPFFEEARYYCENPKTSIPSELQAIIAEHRPDIMNEYNPDGTPSMALELYSLFLKETGPNKIQVIKEIRTATGLGLRGAKDIADNPPAVIMDKVSYNVVTVYKRHLEEAGAVVEIMKH